MTKIALISTMTYNAGVPVSAGSTYYYPVGHGAVSHNQTSETVAEAKFQHAGTLSGMSIYIITNSRSASCTLKLRKNGADGNQSITIGAGVTGIFEDTSNTDTLAANDEVCYEFDVSSGSGTILPLSVCTHYEATTDTVVKAVSLFTYNLFSTATSYTGFPTEPIQHADRGSEASRIYTAQTAFTCDHLAVYVSSNSKAGNVTFKVRKNGADGNQSLTIGTGATGWFEDSSNSDSFSIGDEFAIENETLGTGSFIVLRTDINIITTGTEVPYSAGNDTGLYAAESSTVYIPVFPYISATDTAGYRLYPQLAFTAKRFSVHIAVSTTTATTTINFLIDGVAGNQTLSVGAGVSGLFEDTSNTDAIGATDGISIEIDSPSGSGDFRIYNPSFVADYATGDTYNDSFTETITSSDSLTDGITFGASFTETLTSADSLSSAQTISATFSEAVTAADNVTGSNGWDVFDDGVSAATSATITGLTSGTSYDSRIIAVNSAGLSGVSNVATFVPVTSQIIAANRTMLPQTFTSAASGQTSRSMHYSHPKGDISNLKLVWANWAYDASGIEQANSNAVTIAASVEYPAGVFTQILFSASATATLAAGGVITCDAVDVTIPADTQFWIRTYMLPISGSNIPAIGLPASAVALSTTDGNTAASNATMSGTIAATSTVNYIAPTAIIGDVATAGAKGYIIAGDSIMFGEGDITNVDARGSSGYMARALTGAATYTKICRQGQPVSGAVSVTTRLSSLLSAIGGSYTNVLNAYGVNDLRLVGNAATLKTDMETYIALYDNVTTEIATLTPRTTSVNNWTTVGGQTVQVAPWSAAALTTYNGYVRTGLTGADGYIDTADAVMSARDSSLWAAPPAQTSDGTHMNSAACAWTASIIASEITTPPAFTAPQDLLSFYAGWDATQGVTAPVGGKVTQWDNIGAASIPFTQGTDANRMLTGVDTMNGLNVIVADNTNDSMTATTAGNKNGSTVFVVMNTNADTFYVPISSAGARYLFIAQSGSASTTLSTSSGSPTYRKNGGALSLATRNDAYAAFNGSDNILMIERSDIASWTTTTIGVFGGAQSGIDYAEILIFDEGITLAEKNQVGEYLSAKWGMTWTTIT